MPQAQQQPKKERQEKASVGKDVEKWEPLCPVGGVVSWYSLCGKQYGGSQARGPVGTRAVCLCHSHNNAGSELRLQPTL